MSPNWRGWSQTCCTEKCGWSVLTDWCAPYAWGWPATINHLRAARCKNSDLNSCGSVVAQEVSKAFTETQNGRSFKISLFFPSLQKSCHWRGRVTCSWHHQSNRNEWASFLLLSVAFCSLSPSLSFSPPLSCSRSVFLLAETRGSAAFPGTRGGGGE